MLNLTGRWSSLLDVWDFRVLSSLWQDINWDAATLTIQRSIFHCYLGRPKTTARRKPIPLAPELLTILHERREQTAYPKDTDWNLLHLTKAGQNHTGRTQLETPSLN